MFFFHHLYIQLSDAGGRLIIASDGIWDILSSDMAAKACRGLSAELAAKLVVKVCSLTSLTKFCIVYILLSKTESHFIFQEALRTKGLKDDTTCVVVDIVPSDHLTSAPTPKKKQNTFTAFLSKKKHTDTNNKNGNKLSSVGVEELFEEGSAMLADR